MVVRVAQRGRTGPSAIALLFCAIMLVALPAAARALTGAGADPHPLHHVAAGHFVPVTVQPLSTRVLVRLAGNTPAELTVSDHSLDLQLRIAVSAPEGLAHESDAPATVRTRAPPTDLTV